MRPVARTQEHVGERKLSIRADTLEDVFREAARVVSRAAGPARGEPGPWEHISLTGRDPASLLVDWINELLGRSEVHARAYDDVRDIAVDGSHVEAEVRGRPVIAWRSPIKAATYHGLRLERQRGRWAAQVLLDV